MTTATSNEIPDIVRRALTETVVDIGQLSKSEIYYLNKYVKRNWLSKGKGGPFPNLKTVYAHRDFDFDADREFYVQRAIRLSELDRTARGDYCACGKEHRRRLQRKGEDHVQR